MHPDTLACALCHDQCAFVCPVFRITGDTLSYPSRKGMLAFALERGLIEKTDAKGLFSHCIDCHLCSTECVWLDQPRDAGAVSLAARPLIAELVPETMQEQAKSGGWSQAAISALKALTATVGQEDACAGDSFANWDYIKTVIIWPDPVTLTACPNVVDALVVLAKQAGLRPLIPGEPLVSGAWCTACGQSELAYQQRRATAERLEQLARMHGAEAIVATAPLDVATLVPVWRVEEVPLLTVPAWLAGLLERGKLHLRRAAGSLTFQDSSTMARVLGDTVSPRRVLKAVGNLVEMQDSGRKAVPAAPEGPAPLLPDYVRQELAERRLQAAIATGAATVVTADPDSYVALSRAAASCAHSPAVADISVLVANYL